LAAFATSIVAVRSPEFILIAADSKPTWKGRPGPSVVCKIYRTGALYFAVAGIDHDSGRGFYVKDLVAGGAESSGRFEAQVASVDEKISPRFLVEMKQMKAEDPDEYKFASAEDGPQLTIAFAKFEEGAPYFAVRGFQYDDELLPRVKLSRADCPGANCPQGVLLEYVGKSGYIKDYVAKHGGEKIGAEALARKLVELEIEEAPSTVGPPIELLRIDASGPYWISNEAGCPIVLP
jgi:hypothetical protein